MTCRDHINKETELGCTDFRDKTVESELHGGHIQQSLKPAEDGGK